MRLKRHGHGSQTQRLSIATLGAALTVLLGVIPARAEASMTVTTFTPSSYGFSGCYKQSPVLIPLGQHCDQLPSLPTISANHSETADAHGAMTANAAAQGFAWNTEYARSSAQESGTASAPLGSLGVKVVVTFHLSQLSVPLPDTTVLTAGIVGSATAYLSIDASLNCGSGSSFAPGEVISAGTAAGDYVWSANLICPLALPAISATVTAGVATTADSNDGLPHSAAATAQLTSATFTFS